MSLFNTSCWKKLTLTSLMFMIVLVCGGGECGQANGALPLEVDEDLLETLRVNDVDERITGGHFWVEGNGSWRAETRDNSARPKPVDVRGWILWMITTSSHHAFSMFFFQVCQRFAAQENLDFLLAMPVLSQPWTTSLSSLWKCLSSLLERIKYARHCWR